VAGAGCERLCVGAGGCAQLQTAAAVF